jgi:hypothetical protein
VNLLRFLREQAKNYDCSVCGTNHSRSEISILGKREGAWLVRVSCSKCDTSITLLLYVGEKTSSLAAPTVARQPRRPALSFDDVLDAHELLESYNGDATRLFATREKVKSPSAS